jgi:hypothetical protein
VAIYLKSTLNKIKFIYATNLGLFCVLSLFSHYHYLGVVHKLRTHLGGGSHQSVTWEHVGKGDESVNRTHI